MPFPVLPLYDAGASLEQIKKLSVTGLALFKLKDESDLSIITSNAELLKNSEISIEFVAKVDISKIIELLNNGVSKIFADADYYEELVDAGIPSTRIGLKLSSCNDISKYDASVSVILPSSEPLGDLKAATNGGERSIFVSLDESSHVTINSLVASNLIPIINNEDLTTDKQDGKISISDLFVSSLTTDRKDGLFTTLVTDVHNHSLGLVYSSKESISEAIRTKTGVYQSRRHGLWYKGATSGATQELIKLDKDCDGDCLKFVVKQSGVGFCHLEQDSCFGNISGLARLEKTLADRLENAPEGSYTKRLFTDEKLLVAKIKEEAEELTEAETKEDIAWEAADLFYFALTRCVKNGVSLEDIERNLDLKGLKITRRKGDAKPKFIEQESKPATTAAPAKKEIEVVDPNERILMGVVNTKTASNEEIEAALKRPVQKTSEIMKLVNPIVENVRQKGDEALLEYTAKFDGVKLSSPILKAPFDPKTYAVTQELKEAIDISVENVYKFHKAQLQEETLHVETQPGVVCSRFARPIESVGLYVPGGTAVLPSTTLMLGVPAQVAGCKNIVIASPPRKDGSISPEVVYIAHKIGASAIVLAGGAQAVAALAYGTQSVPKVDKILGPGNQFVTAAKMYVQNDTSALCSIDMPAGPSEVLVIADGKADPDFVASDLLSQAEHGIDSQVILIGVDLSEKELAAIENAVHEQALELPRVEIVRKCIKHSTTLLVSSYDEAFDLSNKYAPEHLILQIANARDYVSKVDNAGSVFVGAYSPESLGDYSSGTNHTLPTYGYAKMYSGVNTATFQKFLTSQDVTPEGLKNIGHAVMSIAKVEGLDAHRNAVKIRMEKLGLLDKDFV